VSGQENNGDGREPIPFRAQHLPQAELPLRHELFGRLVGAALLVYDGDTAAVPGLLEGVTIDLGCLEDIPTPPAEDLYCRAKRHANGDLAAAQDLLGRALAAVYTEMEMGRK
jgi:hypothetical protein